MACSANKYGANAGRVPHRLVDEHVIQGKARLCRRGGRVALGRGVFVGSLWRGLPATEEPAKLAALSTGCSIEGVKLRNITVCQVNGSGSAPFVLHRITYRGCTANLKGRDPTLLVKSELRHCSPENCLYDQPMLPNAECRVWMSLQAT